MSRTSVKAHYYQQHSADYSLEIPAEGYIGWTSANVEIDLGQTALAVMHAWEPGTIETNPRGYHCHEYLPRAQKILQTVFPVLLSATRKSPLRIFHIVGGGNYYKNHPNYLATLQLAGVSAKPEKIEPDKLLTEKHWNPDLSINRERFLPRNFAPEAMPQGDEAIAEDDHQLFILCKKYNVNHLVYIGFALNACLTSSPGGMQDMFRHGLLCSTIRQATTAVENKESARGELHKNAALWKVGLDYGFVFELKDFLDSLRQKYKS